MKKIIGIHEFYRQNPIRADEILWGRKSNKMTRRGFVRNCGLTAIASALGSTIPFAQNMPAGIIPAAFAQTNQDFFIEGKEDLVVLNDRPINAETPAHLLDDHITPAKFFFVRNNGTPPSTQVMDILDWQLSISGESVERNMEFTIKELKDLFKHYTYQLQIECGGNGRSEFFPSAPGNQWSVGAIGCAEWTGIRLKDLLNYVGIKEDAFYVGFYGADTHLSGDPSRSPISRGVPIYKALEEQTLIAWAMNGNDIPLLHGFPLRLICGGWPGSVSGKWLKRLVVRNRIHDGEKMGGNSYRVPCVPVLPGTQVTDDKMCIIKSMPVKSIITFPKSGLSHKLANRLPVRGHAWAGDVTVASVKISIDFGVTWQQANIEEAKNRLAWQHWNAEVTFPEEGYYEVWARATDISGKSQPMVIPGWNPKGYLNNACHRIAVQVA